MPQQQMGICAEEEGVKFTLRKEPASESEVSHSTRSKRAQEHTGVSQIGECETKQTSSCGVACSSGRCGSQVKEMEEQRRKDLHTIQNQQEEMKKLLREKEEQVGRILDRASQQMEKSALRDAAIWWLRLLLTCLPVILVLLLAVFQGWLPLFR